MDRIYLDHSATTPLDKRVLEAMLPYFIDNFGNADSPHQTGRKAMTAVDNARDSLAALLNAKPSEIYFTSGGTESDNWGFCGAAYAQREGGKTQILLSAIEHHALLASAEKLEKEGFEIVYLPVNYDGVVEKETLKGALTEKTAIVAVMMTNNETGSVQPVKALAEIAHESGALFMTDAVQSAPYEKLDVKDLGVDILTLSAHKLYGPKGCGLLYVKSGVKIKGLIVGGEQERGLRGGTTNVPAVVGLAKAYEIKEQERESANEKIATLRQRFLSAIADIDGVEVNGGDAPSIINLRIRGVSNVDFLYNMDLKGVSLSAGSACASASIKPSHVLMAMGRSEEIAKECVRFSLGKNNTEEEILRVATLMKEVIKKLRG